MKAWFEHRELNFGVVDPKKRQGDKDGSSRNPGQWTRAKIFEHADKTSQLTLDDLETPVRNLPVDRYPETGKTRDYAYWVVDMYQIIKADPARFAGSDAEDSPNLPSLEGIYPEDWTRSRLTNLLHLPIVIRSWGGDLG